MTSTTHVRARSLIAGLTLGAAVAFSAVAAAVSSATAQELDWATRAGGGNGDIGVGIATSARGDSYVTGVFTDTATFGQGEPNETTLTSIYGRPGYLRGQVRARRRAAVGHPGRRLRLRRGLRHRDQRARRQLRDRELRWHGDLWRGRAQRDQPHLGSGN